MPNIKGGKIPNVRELKAEIDYIKTEKRCPVCNSEITQIDRGNFICFISHDCQWGICPNMKIFETEKEAEKESKKKGRDLNKSMNFLDFLVEDFIEGLQNCGKKPTKSSEEIKTKDLRLHSIRFTTFPFSPKKIRMEIDVLDFKNKRSLMLGTLPPAKEFEGVLKAIQSLVEKAGANNEDVPYVIKAIEGAIDS